MAYRWTQWRNKFRLGCQLRFIQCSYRTVIRTYSVITNLDTIVYINIIYCFIVRFDITNCFITRLGITNCLISWLNTFNFPINRLLVFRLIINILRFKFQFTVYRLRVVNLCVIGASLVNILLGVVIILLKDTVNRLLGSR